MTLRRVEGREVVPDGVDLTAVVDLVAEAQEDVLDLPPDLRDEVQVAAAAASGPKRHVDDLLPQTPVELGTGQLCGAGVDRLLERDAHGVESNPRLPVAHLAQRQLERAL